MYIKFIFVFSIFLIMNSAQSEILIKYNKEGFIDRSWFENEKQIIERNAFSTSSSGRIYTTKQKFIVIDRNTLEYVPNSSSPETLKYIQDICEKAGMKPAPEPRSAFAYQRMSMKVSFAMECISEI